MFRGIIDSIKCAACFLGKKTNTSPSYRFKDCYCSVLPEKLRYYDLCWLLATQPYITARVRRVSICLSFTSAARPPRLRAVTFLSYICRIYTTGFGQYGTLSCLADSSVLYMPYMRFLIVRPRVCFRLTSDSTSRWTPLPSANTSYCQACSGLSPPSYCPFRANQKKPADFTQRANR